ncbi:MAG: hypothetical protein MMC23_000236 [Stictis urceolatum]|nr:hypothetical protein [Stictis urceolata]
MASNDASLPAPHASKTSPANTNPQPKPPTRSHSIANFRSSLTALVILHHTAISYGGIGVGVYQSSLHPPGSSAALVGFNALNQSFFMGSFFYLSGHFSRRALERKSRSSFIKDRLYRLGLPTVAYTMIGPPLCTAILRMSRGQSVGLSTFVEYWKTVRGVRGPVWFTGVLFVFDLALAACFSKTGLELQHEKHLTMKESMGSLNESRKLSLLAGISGCTALSVLWQMRFPVGSMFTPLFLNLGYFPQYIAAYLYGVYVKDPCAGLPTTFDSLCMLLPGIASTIVLGKAVNANPHALMSFQGGWNLLTANYAIWNNFVGFLLGSSLLAGFPKFGSLSLGRIAEMAYPAFLVHMPVSVLIEAYTDHWKAGAVTETAVVGTANVVASWVVGYFVSSVWGKLCLQARKLSAAKDKGSTP